MNAEGSAEDEGALLRYLLQSSGCLTHSTHTNTNKERERRAE